jgi:transcriptional regulator with XRE-family HTH domain
VIQVEQHPAWHQRLRRERKLRNWSQAYVAESIGSNTKTVSRWEQGKAFPGPYLRQKLVELFGMSSEELGLVFEQEEEGFEASRYWPHPLAPSPSLMERGKRCWRMAPGAVRGQIACNCGAFASHFFQNRAQLWRICALFFGFFSFFAC